MSAGRGPDVGDVRLGAPSSAAAAAVVVVGLDGSDTSWDAFWWACGEARRLGGRAIVVYVGPSPEACVIAASTAFTGVTLDYAAMDQVTTDQADLLRTQVQGYAIEHDVDLTFVSAGGDTANELLRVAEERHADLIVVGRSEKARHHLAGSLGRRLVGRRGAPVVVVVP